MFKQDLEYYIEVADEAAAGFEGFAPILKKFLSWVKYYQTKQQGLLQRNQL